MLAVGVIGPNCAMVQIFRPVVKQNAFFLAPTYVEKHGTHTQNWFHHINKKIAPYFNRKENHFMPPLACKVSAKKINKAII
eukprot:14731441-Ditylum_brightwellii.AAC.1